MTEATHAPEATPEVETAEKKDDPPHDNEELHDISMPPAAPEAHTYCPSRRIRPCLARKGARLASHLSATHALRDSLGEHRGVPTGRRLC